MPRSLQAARGDFYADRLVSAAASAALRLPATPDPGRPGARRAGRTPRAQGCPQLPGLSIFGRDTAVSGLRSGSQIAAGTYFSIGETGFEPATARPPAGCATRLRHS